MQRGKASMDISIIGSGYVGLVTGACLADLGNNVICIDNNLEKIYQLKNGIVPIYEPGLRGLISVNVREGRLSFSEDIKEGVDNAEIIFIAVGTPSKGNGDADLSAIEKVCREVARVMTSYRLIVEKSTVPVNTGQWVFHTIRHNNVHHVDFDVASNPEFLREGCALEDFMNPDRIILGVSSDRAANLLVKLYEPLNAPILITDINSAELIKHASNAFLAMKISFINSVANICEKTGADIHKVAKGIGLDRRIGEAFLQAGIGYGGSCFPKDVSAFIHLAEKIGYDFTLLKAVKTVNDYQRTIIIAKLKELNGNLKGKVVGILGLAFKPNTDDMRGAPSVDIIRLLQSEGAIVKAYDPVAEGTAQRLMPDITYCNNPYEVANGANALVVVTEWKEFKLLDLLKIKSLMKSPVIIDGRNIYDPAKMRTLGFVYRGIGRP
jgi:UDPglucose 6-dehydrogenase